MTWAWRYRWADPESATEPATGAMTEPAAGAMTEPAAGATPEPTPGPEVARAVAPDSFPTQSDAETWLGEHWRELRASGVLSVVLLEGDRVAYGPMVLEV